MAVNYTYTFFVPFQFNLNPVQIGLVFISIPGFYTIFSLIVGVLSDKLVCKLQGFLPLALLVYQNVVDVFVLKRDEEISSYLDFSCLVLAISLSVQQILLDDRKFYWR